MLLWWWKGDSSFCHMNSMTREKLNLPRMQVRLIQLLGLTTAEEHWIEAQEGGGR
jgi:hypothetical protein